MERGKVCLRIPAPGGRHWQGASFRVPAEASGSSRSPPLVVDVQLDTQGIKDAEECGELLRTMPGMKFKQAFASALHRAQVTLELVLEHAGVRVYSRATLAAWHGKPPCVCAHNLQRSWQREGMSNQCILEGSITMANLSLLALFTVCMGSLMSEVDKQS